MKVIGHRGAKGLAPENTIASFEKALEHNVSAIECDTHLTADNVAVLHHDMFFMDPDGQKIPLKSLTFDELRVHKPDITTLDEALEFVDGKCELLVEIKPDVPTSMIGTLLTDYQSKGHSVCVLSFDYKLLKAMKREFPNLPLVINEDWSGVRATYRARKLGTKRVQMNRKVLWSGFAYSMYKAGYLLSPYTVNDPQQIKSYQKYIHGVITDYPDRFQ